MFVEIWKVKHVSPRLETLDFTVAVDLLIRCSFFYTDMYGIKRMEAFLRSFRFLHRPIPLGPWVAFVKVIFAALSMKVVWRFVRRAIWLLCKILILGLNKLYICKFIVNTNWVTSRILPSYLDSVKAERRKHKNETI